MFEWGPGALFLIPRFHVHEFTNASGSEPARLLHANYLPLVMSITPEAEVYFDSPIAPPPLPPDQLYSAARMLTRPASYAPGGVTTFWYGNFFPDMRIWDQLAFQSGRGAGARSVTIELPNSPMSAHMPVFHAGLYKKAHRHGPAFVIVIPAGEGYSIMWPQGQEKVIVPWHEASVFVPPAGWYHQHFNVGATPARYLALHPPRGFNDHFRAFKGQDDDGGEGADRSPATLGQIEYPDEEVWIREYFEAELGKRGLKSRMPPEAYRDRDFQWSATAE